MPSGNKPAFLMSGGKKAAGKMVQVKDNKKMMPPSKGGKKK